MLIPTHFCTHLANTAFTGNALREPERFKSFYGYDHLTFDEFKDNQNSTWHEYSFLSVKCDGIPTCVSDIVGFMKFPIDRPDKKITGVKIGLFRKECRMTFFYDLLECLKMIHTNNHPSLRFATFHGTDAWKMYENLTKNGFLVKYEIPFNWTIALGKKEYWHNYAMDHKMLGELIEKYNR